MLSDNANVNPFWVAEIELNKAGAIRVNDAEHREFRIKCIEDRREMAEVIRKSMREYVEGVEPLRELC